MSTYLSQARARALRPVAAPSRPGLTVVPKAAARTPRMPFVLLVVIILGVGLVGLLVLNTSLERGAYTSGALQVQAARLDARQQALEKSVAADQQPLRLAKRAERLGMVQNTSLAFIQLHSGKVVGATSNGTPAAKVNLGALSRGTRTAARKVVEIPAGGHATGYDGPYTVGSSHGSARRSGA